MEFHFDLASVEIPVSIAGRAYVLREASEDAARLYRNEQIRGAKLGPDGKPQSIGSVADADSVLLAACLFEKHEDGKDRPLLPIQIRAWPRRITKVLIDKVKEISAIDQPDTPETVRQEINRLQETLAGMEESNGAVLKNSPAATTAT